MSSFKVIPQIRTVRNFMDSWIATNGNADPRSMLDRYFWSYLDASYGIRSRGGYVEMDAWCNATLGEENWYRMFNKYWFTSESDLTIFKLTWTG